MLTGSPTAYWKGNSQSQPQSEGSSQRIATQVKQSVRRGRGFTVASSDEDQSLPSPKNPVLAKSTQNRSQTGRRTQSRAKSRPLFLDSDDDKDDEIVLPIDQPQPIDEGHDDDAVTVQSESTARSKPTTSNRASKKVPIIVDDDSDDGATFKGFRGKSRGTR